MQVYKVLPSTLNPIMVRNTLAVYGGFNVETRSVGDLVALAKVGGTTVPGRTPAVKSAFAISEVGSGVNDGALIAGAEPFFNVWADKSPGEWVLPASSDDPVNFRLKRKFDGIKYGFDLQDYAFHDIEAPAPTPFGLTRTFTKGAAGSSVTFDAVLKITTGNYNWSKSPLLATHCKCLTYDAGGLFVSESTQQPIDTSGNLITFSNVSFTVSTASVATYEWTSKIALCNSVGDILAMLPVTGSVVIEVVADVVNTLKVTIAGNPKVFATGSTLIGGGSIYANGTYNSSFGISANGRTLDSITYTIYNSSTNAVVSQTTVTSFNAYEYPTVLDIYGNGEQETFYASYGNGRPTPGAGQYLGVYMEYI